MSGWDRAKELTQKNAGGIFIRLQNDGEKFVAAFRGDPFAREMHWVGEEFRERLSRLPKETAYYPILGTFGCERLDEILAVDEHRARALIERAERGERLNTPPAPKNELDEFQ